MEKFETVMQTRDAVEGLLNLSSLDQVVQLTNIKACKALLIVLLSFAFSPRAQMGRDGQSPNQNLEKFSSFEFRNICT